MSGAISWIARNRVVALVVVAIAAATAALWPAAASIAGNWFAIRDYQHGFLIAPVAVGWLLATALRWRAAPIRVSAVGSTLLAGALAVWLVALRAHSDIAIEALFPAAVWLTILAAAGWQIARACAAPVGYLYFAIPVWEFLLPTMQWLSVHVTEAALGLAGIPAEVSEYVVTLRSGSFEIIEGCSGKRYFVVALAVSVIAGVLRHLRGWRLVTLVALGGVLALFANWLRIFVVIAAGHATDMQHYLVAIEHQTFGNVVFALLLVGIYAAAWMVAPRPAGRNRTRSAPGGNWHTTTAAVSAAVTVPFLLLAAAAVMVRAPVAIAAMPQTALAPLPVAAGAWQGPMPPLPAWSPSFVGPDAERRASYLNANGGAIQLYLNLYRSQQPGKELVYYENSLFSPGTWSRVWPERTGRLEVSGAPALAAAEVESPVGQRWLVAYVYQVGGLTTTKAPLAQASYGLLSLIRPAPAGIVSLTVQCAENCQKAQALVRLFWQDMSTSLLGMIPDDAA